MTALVDLLLSNALAAAILALLVAAACLVIRRPAVRNALWMIVIIRLFLPPIWNVPVLGNQTPSAEIDDAIQVAPILQGIENSIAATELDEAPFLGLMDYWPEIDWDAPFRAGDAEVFGIPPANVPEQLDVTPREVATIAPAPAGPALDEASSRFALRIPYSAFAMTWAIGALAIAILAFVRIRRFNRALRDAVRAPQSIQARAGMVAAQLGVKRCPTVWIVPGRIPPMLWMPGRRCAARIIIPADLAFRLADNEMSALLAHELAHFRRGDPWVRWLELLAQIVYWWHPLLGWFRRGLRDSEEQCCDAWVVAALPSRRAYATALVETVAFLDGEPAAWPSPQLASGAGPVRQLQRRVGMIMRGNASARLTRWGILGALVVGAGALAVGPALSQDRDRDREPQPKEKKVERPRPDGERPAPPRGERPEGERPQPPKERGREEGPRANQAEIEKARDEFEKARAEAERAMKRVHEAEARLRQLTGRGEGGRPEFPPDGRGERGPGPGIGADGGPERMFREMQRQMQEMREMIEQLRREMRGGGEGGNRRGPGPEGVRPREPRPEEPKRPAEPKRPNPERP